MNSTNHAEADASIEITTVSNQGDGYSEFGSREICLRGDALRQLSEQQAAKNFRLRKSSADYASDFHVAGDPTLLVILAGRVRLELRSGEYRDFGAGEMFIAEDYLKSGVVFSNKMHGHSARVIGAQSLSALHLKLQRREE